MQRRNLLKLGLASAAVLALAGGAASMMQPGLVDGRLGSAGRTVVIHVGRALLEGSLPAGPQSRQAALQGLLERVDALTAALPPHAQAELSQLLALLATLPGRRALAGLEPDWADAGAPEIQQALQSMRTSGLSLRQQAYQALHDIVGAAYFSDAQTWGQLGYPGPTPA